MIPTQSDAHQTFAELGIPDGLAEVLAELGFVEPFEVQARTIPDAVAGHDIAARAPTGSGKTLAFGLPLLLAAAGARPGHPRGLVLAPTRELADQIRRELEPIARAGERRIATVYGGVGYDPQRRALRRGVDILVACPGRLADLIEQGDVDLDEVTTVVVDEADRMSDMGFLPEVKRLLNRTPADRQTLLFSATLDGDVGVLSRDYQRDPVRHEVGDPEPDIELMRHLFWRLDRTERIRAASDLIQAAGPTIVFCRTRRGADRVAAQLARAGASAAAIHGSRSQNQRNRALRSFAEGKVEALVATDVAARGIHIDGVACVLHFDPPVDDKTYVHRSGRTARAGAEGAVVSFITADDLRDATQLVRRLQLSADLATPAPDSLPATVERLEADSGRSFADPDLAAADASRVSTGAGRSGRSRGGRPGAGRPGGGRAGGGRAGGGRRAQHGEGGSGRGRSEAAYAGETGSAGRTDRNDGRRGGRRPGEAGADAPRSRSERPARSGAGAPRAGRSDGRRPGSRPPGSVRGSAGGGPRRGRPRKAAR